MSDGNVVQFPEPDESRLTPVDIASLTHHECIAVLVLLRQDHEVVRRVVTRARG